MATPRGYLLTAFLVLVLFPCPRAGASAVYFNAPTERAADGSVRAGAILRMDLPSRTLQQVSGGLHNPSGIAFNPGGVLYFGDVSYGYFTIQLMEQRPGQPASNIATVTSTNQDTAVSASGWGFDVISRGGDLLFTSPAVINLDNTIARPGSIDRFDPVTRSRTALLTDLHNSSGLSLDAQGNLYFCDVATRPLRAELTRLSPAGVVTKLATTFDTSEGSVFIGGWGASTAVYGGSVYFNRPTLSADDGTVLRAGSIERLDLATGEQSTFVPDLHYPAGLSFDAEGNLFFGDVTHRPLSCEVMERQAGGALIDLGPVEGLSTSLVSAGWAFDTLAPEPNAMVLIAGAAFLRRRRRIDRDFQPSSSPHAGSSGRV